jgi:hypothetical protein
MSDDTTFRALAALAFLFLLAFGPTQCQRAEVAEQRSTDLVKDLERAIKKKDWERVSGIVENFAISGDGNSGYEVDNHGWHSTE